MLTSVLTAITAFMNKLFVGSVAGTIFKTLIGNLASKQIAALSNPDLQKYGWNLAVQLYKDETKSGLEKAAEFNKKLLAYAQEKGIVAKTSLVNTIRELACQAIEIKLEKGESVEEVKA